MCSIARDTKFTVSFVFVCMYRYGFLSPGFTDRREILHGSSATSLLDDLWKHISLATEAPSDSFEL